MRAVAYNGPHSIEVVEWRDPYSPRQLTRSSASCRGPYAAPTSGTTGGLL
jgi:hypothetical protein